MTDLADRLPDVAALAAGLDTGGDVSAQPGRPGCGAGVAAHPGPAPQGHDHAGPARPVTRTAAIALGPMFESKGKSDRSQS